jgi:predicted ATP-dependent serine protease
MTDAQLVERLLAGERRALARLLTRVEDGSEERLREVVRLIHPHTGGAHLVGVTGSPGVGKSTLTNTLVDVWRKRDRRVAVLAIDPKAWLRHCRVKRLPFQDAIGPVSALRRAAAILGRRFLKRLAPARALFPELA